MVKGKNETWKWWAMFGGLMFTGAALVWNAAVLSTSVSKELSTNTNVDQVMHQALQQQATLNREAILMLQGDVRYIRESVDEIKLGMQTK